MRRLSAALIVPIALAAGCASSAGSGTSAGNANRGVQQSPTPAAASAGAAATTFTNWPNYHLSASKDGHTAKGVKGPLHRAWSDHLDGGVWSEPVIANGILIAATEHDVVYGINPRTGKQVWRSKLGKPEPLSEQPCGDINPIGITSAPAYDPATGSVFVVTTTGKGTHTLWALNAKTGARRWHRNVDVDKSRDRNAEQQRSPLLVIDGRVIVTYGAHDGDCGNYVGYATSTSTSGKGKIPYYAVPNASQAGMWSPAGPVKAIDGNILVPTANGSNRSGGKWDHSDGIVEINPTTMHYVRGWAPANWLQGDKDDLSLSSTSPVRVDGKYVVGGKRGVAWLLKPGLGGVHGELAAKNVNCPAFGGAAAAGHTVILPCKYGDESILALTVGKHSLRTSWRTADIYGSPIIAGSRIYVADLGSGDLKVLSLKTGRILSSIAVGSLPTFPSEVVDGNHVFVPTLSGITAIRGS
jgi:outer membrane protein assembly factor BamB